MTSWPRCPESDSIGLMRRKKLTNNSRTPLRYPGGKGKVTCFVNHLLDLNDAHGTYVEPFAGGAGVAVNLLLFDRVDRVVINDLDPGVNSFWWALKHEPDKLISLIRQVPFDIHTTREEFGIEERRAYWKKIHDRYFTDNDRGQLEIGFDFFMLNRMNVSGIIKGGPIGGHAQDGKYDISVRFNRDDLIHRIERIAERSDSIIVSNDEASHFCKKVFSGRFDLDPDDTFMFIDPPYYGQGRNLYNSYATNIIHELVCEQLLEHGKEYKWILTYDDAPYIRDLYDDERVNGYRYGITYSANRHGTFNELLYAPRGLAIESFDNVDLMPIG